MLETKTPFETRGGALERSETARMERARSLINGYQSTCVLIAAADLAIFDELAHQPKEISALAIDCRADEDALHRLVRALVAYGLVAAKNNVVALTDTGRLFVQESGLAAQVLMLREQYLSAWTQLGYSARSGRPAFANVFGMSPWEHRRRNPAINAAFNRTVAGAQAIAVATILEAHDFSQYRRVADIGGGNGYLIAAILRNHGSVTALLFELPQVVESAVSHLRSAGVDDRCRVVAGSFFERLPRGCDVYILQYILHDWSDEDCVAILSHCREAMRRKDRLLVMEKVCPDEDSAVPLSLVMRDLHMMAVLGGRERKLHEYDDLLEAVAMRRTAYVPMPSFAPDIIEVEAR